MEDKIFKCIRCGSCCKNIGYVEEASHLDRGDGVCKYYNDDEKLCTIYEFRPDICRVDKMYKRYKDKMSYDKYLASNYEACDELRDLERQKKVKKLEEEAKKEMEKIANGNNFD